MQFIKCQNGILIAVQHISVVSKEGEHIVVRVGSGVEHTVDLEHYKIEDEGALTAVVRLIEEGGA